MRFSAFIAEARKNAHLYDNDRVHTATSKLEEIRKKHPGRELFVTFTNVNKFGINPTNTFATPTGLYTYSLDYVIDKLKGSQVPFAGDRKYMVVMSPKKDQTVLEIPGDIPKSVGTLDDVLNTSTAFIKQRFGLNLDVSIIYKAYRPTAKSVSQAFFWAINRSIQMACFLKHNFGTTDAGLVGSNKNAISGFIFYSTAGDVFDINDEDLTNYRSPLSRKIRLYNDVDGDYPITMHTSAMSSLLRRLGFAGVHDDGSGTIHPNEAWQAFFMSTQVMDYIDTALNPGFESQEARKERGSKNINRESDPAQRRSVPVAVSLRMRNSSLMKFYKSLKQFDVVFYRNLLDYVARSIQSDRRVPEAAYVYDEIVSEMYRKLYTKDVSNEVGNPKSELISRVGTAAANDFLSNKDIRNTISII